MLSLPTPPPPKTFLQVMIYSKESEETEFRNQLFAPSSFFHPGPKQSRNTEPGLLGIRVEWNLYLTQITCSFCSTDSIWKCVYWVWSGNNNWLAYLDTFNQRLFFKPAIVNRRHLGWSKPVALYHLQSVSKLKMKLQSSYHFWKVFVKYNVNCQYRKMCQL